MTALTRYARLEATALWRATPEAQRQEVVVSIGDATLVISNLNDRPLTHWSLAAVERSNPGETPAIYHPDGDPGETVEIAENEAEMIDAIETLRRAITRARPRPGRLRVVGMVVSIVVVAALVLFWLPGAMQEHTLRVVPGVKRTQIGLALLGRIERVSGPACGETAGRAALALLAKRLSAGQLAVLPDMTKDSLHLPGGLILLDRSVIEDFEEPDIAAGYVLTEMTRLDDSDPLRDLLRLLLVSLGAFAVGMSIAVAISLFASSLLGLPLGQLLLAYAPGGLEAMTLLAYLLDLDPAFVAAHQLARYFGMVLLLPFATRRILGPPQRVV
jgi:hypothetical protein